MHKLTAMRLTLLLTDLRFYIPPNIKWSF